MRSVARALLPPLVLDAYHKLRRTASLDAPRYGWFGRYPDWASALRDSAGYGAEAILERVRDALLKVKRGQAVYERDSVLFDRREYSWPVLAALLWIASLNGNRLTVLDFGGSLGSSYFQNRNFLAHLDPLRWYVVEQPNFVRVGRADFEDEVLKFSGSVNEVLGQTEPDVCLLSSVLHYIERPFAVLGDLSNTNIEFLLLDMVPFLYEGTDRITVQRVPPQIYPASYPAWFFNQSDFLRRLEGSYEVVVDFDSYLGQMLEIDGRAAGRYRGILLQRKV